MEEYELNVITQDGAEHDFSREATEPVAALEEAQAFLKVAKARGWQVTKAQIVSIRKTGVLTVPLD